MKAFAIAQNTFLQTIRQPIFGILILVTFAILVLAAPLAGWTMGETGGDYHDTDQKMLENLGLSTLLVSGLFIAAFSASSALSREIEDRTALTVISKPVRRTVFIMGKFAGMASAVVLAYYLCSLVFLMTVRHRVMPAASDPYDIPVIVLGISAMALTIIIALAGNYLFGWQFTSAGIWAGTILFTVAMATLMFVGKDWKAVPPGYDVAPEYQIKIVLNTGQDKSTFLDKAKREGFPVVTSKVDDSILMSVPDALTMGQTTGRVTSWDEVASVQPVATKEPVIHGRLISAMIMTLMGVLILSAVALAASTRLGQVMTLVVTFGVFIAGSMHPALKLWSHIPAIRPLQWLTPNFNYFYAMDALSQPIVGKTPITFLLWAGVYCVLYTAAVLALGVGMFQRRELAADQGSSGAPAGVGLLSGLGRIAAVILALAAVVAISMPEYHTLKGLSVTGGMLIAAAALWVLLGCFAKGARWSYWVVLTVSVGWLVSAAAMLYTSFISDQMLAVGILQVALGIALVVTLGHSKTRRHFARA